MFKFYNHRAPKRKTHLKETAKKLNTAFYELNYIFRTRWISSEFRAISNVKKVWLLIIKDLEEVSRNRLKFDIEVRNKATALSTKLKGKNVLVLLNFVYDVLEHLSFWSKKMQERAALLIDFVDFKDKIIQTFESLKTQNGEGINLSLENCTCDEETCETIEAYYSSEKVEYLEIPLSNDRGAGENEVPFLYEIRNSFLEKIKKEMNSYFPMKDLSLFKIFRPSMIPSEVEASLTYGVREITGLCRIFRFGECDALLKDWSMLLESIIESESFCILKKHKRRNVCILVPAFE